MTLWQAKGSPKCRQINLDKDMNGFNSKPPEQLLRHFTRKQQKRKIQGITKVGTYYEILSKSSWSVWKCLQSPSKPEQENLMFESYDSDGRVWASMGVALYLCSAKRWGGGGLKRRRIRWFWFNVHQTAHIGKTESWSGWIKLAGPADQHCHPSKHNKRLLIVSRV